MVTQVHLIELTGSWPAVMTRFLIMFCIGFAFVISAQAQDPHLHEPGSAAVLSHSCFAHGYRHGYEEGFHLGNTDVTLGTQPRVKLKDVHGLKLGYSSQFGPRHVFQEGFQAGLNAGYRDGYSGRAFRAVDSLRLIAVSLESLPSQAPKSPSFDEGFTSGYHQGLDRGISDHSFTAQVNFHYVSCSHPAPERDSSGQESYCEGYRRGFALGHADGFALRPDAARLEASK
jgi:hypothetical protein